ncbi:hypothetical protein AGR2A_pb10211 [Agrobacterium genomosp. 2 str. CFBP 5494]|uniref:Uncharacterized protein n=1 Tax=Agrobacterium genomosp. 2 str. CFBP 5494 TaxID=1183436 RepID=A0A9W5B7S6_9HYPH|nr:hypothetical protein AGR2A_pb10211 [Agrobacterium genomosp. 2 str. CFBP 5494]
MVMASLQSGRRIHRLWGLPSCRDLVASGPTCDFVGEDMIVRRSDTIAVELDLNNSILISKFCAGYPHHVSMASVSFQTRTNRSGSTLHVMTGVFIC